ncbi:MAG: DUF4129 domain-containing protein [Bacteroidaceae bacterium]|nr:DUF4129 domain-containing protein [Bacteroidaceae bacterium]
MPDNAQHTMHIDTALIREWQQSGDYNYLDEVVEVDSATTGSTQVVPKKDTRSTSFSIPPTAIWCCVGVLVLVILFFAVRNGWFMGFSKKKSKKEDVEKKKKEEEEETTEAALIQEEIFGFDFRKLTAEALAEKNYTAALKYVYMQAFRQLCEADLLTWRKDATPSEYAAQVEGVASEPFRRITTAYVRSQYGHYEVTEDHYSAAKADLEELENHVRTIIEECRRKEQEEAEKAALQEGGEA